MAVPGSNSYFLATPILDGRVHHAYMTGAVQMSLAAGDRFIVNKFTGSYMPGNRDSLTHNFLRSSASHMLCVDPDIGWSPEHVNALAAANQDFITGMYAKKQPDRALAQALLETRAGELLEVQHTAAAFMLLSRSCIEQLVTAHPELVYDTGIDRVCSIWSPTFAGQPYSEDMSFCARWRALGGRIWAHSRVVLRRYGDSVLLPRGFDESGGPAR
ncbi:MAG: hypothetical protein ABUL62_18820 [Myxococcales bacterium]